MWNLQKNILEQIYIISLVFNTIAFGLKVTILMIQKNNIKNLQKVTSGIIKKTQCFYMFSAPRASLDPQIT